MLFVALYTYAVNQVQILYYIFFILKCKIKSRQTLHYIKLSFQYVFNFEEMVSSVFSKFSYASELQLNFLFSRSIFIIYNNLIKYRTIRHFLHR